MLQCGSPDPFSGLDVSMWCFMSVSSKASWSRCTFAEEQRAKFRSTPSSMNENISEELKVAAAKFHVTSPLGDVLTSLPSCVVIYGALVALILWLSDSTDVPFIKHLPSIPGLPIVGNLVQLGTEQPRRLAELSKKYGPVFQIRLGNKVSPSVHMVTKGSLRLTLVPAVRCSEQLRVRQATVDRPPI